MLCHAEMLHYAEKMSLVADDMTTHIIARRDHKTGVVVPEIEEILFRWSLECMTKEFLYIIYIFLYNLFHLSK